MRPTLRAGAGELQADDSSWWATRQIGSPAIKIEKTTGINAIFNEISSLEPGEPALFFIHPMTPLKSKA